MISRLRDLVSDPCGPEEQENDVIEIGTTSGGGYLTPSTAERWLAVAHERGTDANTLKSQERSLAAVYMIGYTVECTLKALLQRNGKRIPTSGRGGHDLRSLWEAVGFKLHDIQGRRRHFIEYWTTDLRYLHALPVETDGNALYSGAIELTGYIQKHVRRSKGRRFL